MANTTFSPNTNVHIKLLPSSVLDEVDESIATQIYINPMDNRVRRPYPPSSLSLNTVAFLTAASLEGVGTGGESYAILLSLNRRDYRTGEGHDEIVALTTDAQVLFLDYPAANSTDHELEVRNDPGGTNTLLFTSTFGTQTYNVLRIDILIATNGVLPTSLGFVVRSRHFVAAVQYDSRYDLLWDFTTVSALSGQFNFGVLDTNIVSNLYTATAAGTYTFFLSTPFVGGSVEYRLNGGAFTLLIAAGNTNGTILGVVVSDTIEIRHTSTDVGAKKHVDVVAPGAGQHGYAVLVV